MLTQTDIERERYKARRKAQLDYTSGMNAARRESQEIGRIHAYENLFGRPETPEEHLRCLSSENLTHLAEELKKQALSR